MEEETDEVSLDDGKTKVLETKEFPFLDMALSWNEERLTTFKSSARRVYPEHANVLSEACITHESFPTLGELQVKEKEKVKVKYGGMLLYQN
eukprot:6798443-Ditylum_brightwellii.AAC.1